jgi:sugar phosphate isomerase/epimerase
MEMSVDSKLMRLIGISLPPEYIVGESDKSTCAYTRALGDASHALPRLKECGIGSIELRMVRTGTSPDLVVRALETVRRHDLRFTIHGLLPVDDARVGEIAQFPLWHVADWIREEQGEAVVTVHARYRSEPDGDLAEMAEKTRLSLVNLLQEIDNKDAPFVIALEINKMKAKTDPSYTWDSVNSIVESIGHPALGVCWDMGHSFYNTQQGLIPKLPPPSFTQKVLQTHMHDLSPHGQTHWSLRENVVPLQEFCQWLHQHEYKGVYNLEIDPYRFKDDPELPRLLYDSAETLTRIIQSLGA